MAADRIAADHIASVQIILLPSLRHGACHRCSIASTFHILLSKLCLPQPWIKAMATHRIAADHIASTLIASVTTK